MQEEKLLFQRRSGWKAACLCTAKPISFKRNCPTREAAGLVLLSQPFCPVAKLNFISVIDSDFFILASKKRKSSTPLWFLLSQWCRHRLANVLKEKVERKERVIRIFCSTNIFVRAGEKLHTVGVNPQQAKAKALWFFLSGAAQKHRADGRANIMLFTLYCTAAIIRPTPLSVTLTLNLTMWGIFFERHDLLEKVPLQLSCASHSYHFPYQSLSQKCFFFVIKLETCYFLD